MEEKIEELSRFKKLLMVVGIVFIASNLRAPLTAVGPVITEISNALSLSNTTAGLVTTIPLLAFGFLSSVVPKISKKYGMEMVLMGSLLLLSIGLIVRPYGSLITLLLGAALVGIAITVGNVLMPAYIKKHFQHNVGLMMGIYSIGMNLTAALAAGYSISLGRLTEMGWQGSIGIWIVLSVFSAFIWLPQVTSNRRKQSADTTVDEGEVVNLYKSKIAWAVTIFMGVQSLLFYCFAAWLPKVAMTWGVPTEEAGWLLSYAQFAQLPMTFIGSIVAGKVKSQKVLAIATALLFTIGIGGLLIFKLHFIELWCVLIGAASGFAFGLAMLFFVLRTNSTAQAAELSGMAQSIGYLIAASGPPIFGALYDMTKSWTYSLIFLVIMTFVLVASGAIAGRNAKVE